MAAWKVVQATCSFAQIIHPSATIYNQIMAHPFHWVSQGLNNGSELDVVPHVRYSYGK